MLSLDGHGQFTTHYVKGFANLVVTDRSATAITKWLSEHSCATTVDVKTGELVPMQLERRSWQASFGDWQAGCYVTIMCKTCESRTTLHDDEV